MLRPDRLPRGTVTFLFSDVEGSTRLLHELGAEPYADALAEHRRVLREAFRRHEGVEVETQGDAFFVAFPTAPGALRAAAEIVEGLAQGPIRVRIGIHTGTPLVTDEGYVGADVHRAARIAAAGHGGQILVSAATAGLAEAAGLRDLGEHRLKDLSAPERIYQFGTGDLPPLRTLYQTNLPIPATPFLGRERELAEVVGLLAREDLRLLTLTGPGGTGKTRLALQAAGALAERYPHGIWWVPLAPLRDPGVVMETAARVLGAKDGLPEHIRDRQMLLLFDNFEHLVEVASELAALLAACPRVNLLVTSREPLQVTGEQEYPVPPLTHEEGVTFFVARARAHRPDFAADAAIPEICRRLDHLPLALELAAARVKSLTPDQILERLQRRLPLLTTGARDLPARQRTLRATIEWSHDLLRPDEQHLFAWLAVFRGGCTLAVAEQVADADLDTLQTLVDKSVLRHRDDRFWMLETIREYAAERLEALGEVEEIGRRHAEHYLALAEEAEPHLRSGNPTAWLARLDPELDNLRAAFDHLAAAGETQLVLRLVGALPHFWWLRGHVLEGRRRAEDALAADEQPTRARARALNAAAHLASLTGDRALERRRLEEALALHDALGDERGAALSRYNLATILVDDRQFETAREHAQRSLAEFEALGDKHYTLNARRFLAWMNAELGDIERFRELTEQNLELARAHGNKRIEARALGALCMLALDEGRPDDARVLLEESFRIDRELGFSIFVAIDLVRFAAISLARGDGGTAARLIARADALREELGVALELWAANERERTLASVRSALEEAAFAQAWEEGRRLSLDEAVALALSPPSA
jgi:predicted ATPase/class 3 adenylate cyclase